VTSEPDATVVPFVAGDGRELRLLRFRGARTPTKGPVLLIHGAGVRANIFRAPVEENVAGRLIREGYEPWLEEWRASIELPFSRWTLDQAALFDHPKAVETIVRETGAARIKAIVCRGSTSSRCGTGGPPPVIRSCNACRGQPIIPAFAKFKLMVAAHHSWLKDHLDPS
jgi:hypothetical protein